MIPYERHELILGALQERDLLKIDELQALMPEVSISTLRRDLKELEKRGSIEYLAGGAVKLHGTSHEVSISEKSALRSAEKDVIAQLAAAEVTDGDTVYIDSGSSCTALLRLLLDRPVTIYTTNGAACSVMGQMRARLNVIGGEFNPETSSLTGPMTEGVLRDLYFDKAFIGVNAVDEDRGVMTPQYAEAVKKRLVRENSNVAYVLCDSSKFHQFSNVKVFDLSGVVLVSERTDAKLGEHARMLTPEK